MSALFNANQEFINHGTAASLVDIDSPTYIFIVRALAYSFTTGRLIYSGGTGASIGWGAAAPGGQVNYTRIRATTNSVAASATGSFALNDRVMVAVTDDYGSSAPRIYLAINGGTLTEVSYTTQTQGVGAVTAAADSFRVGSRNSNNTWFEGEISYGWVYNRILTLSEMKAHADPRTVLPDCQLRISYWDVTSYGLRDWSGKGNHGTINNFPTRANHHPSVHLFAMPDFEDDPYIVPAANVYPLVFAAPFIAQSPIPVAYH